MPEKKHQYGTATIAGKVVPLTKNGLPNRVHLPKETREVVKAFEVKAKEKKTAEHKEEIEEFLRKLIGTK